MVASLRTLVGIVRLRPTPTRSRSPRVPRRAVRPDVTPVTRPAFADAAQPAPPAPKQRWRLPRRGVVIGGVVAVLLAAVATAAYLTLPRIDRAAEPTLTNDATPTLAVTVAHPGTILARDVTATVDGRRVDASDVEVLDAGERIEVRSHRLDDGEHRAEVTVRGAGVLQRTLRQGWTFTVDTTAPPARVVAPVPAREASAYVDEGVAVVTELPLRLTVGAEIGSELEVRSDAEAAEQVEVAASETTRRTVEVALPEGAQTLTVVATDPAGNATERTLPVLVDTTGPALQARVPRIVRSSTLELPITARDAHGVQLQVMLDGAAQEDAIREVAVTDAPHADRATTPAAGDDDGSDADADAAAAAAPSEGGDDDADDASDDEPLPIGGRFVLELEDGAYEGRHALEVTATDSLGTRTTVKRTFFVDSSEQLSEVSGLRTGARGGDVAQLHEVLLEEGVVARAALAEDLRTRTYGAQTRAAVQRYQQQQGMEVDGVAGADTIAGLTLEIVIDRTANTLTLYRVGQVVKTYPVATGAPEFETPAGEFEIQTKQVDPTWTPPDSDWAKDAKPIPPGPDNPLGTRWMAFDGTVGIHGTNNPASIGGSVSHGCVRMHIPDVEELYELVAIGTRVRVV